MATNQTTLVAPDIRDLKPPIEIPDGLAWLWGTLAALALGIILFALWKYFQKQKQNVPIAPPVPAHIRAKQKLEAALTLIAQPKPFVIAVSDTARTWRRCSFGLHHCPGSTWLRGRLVPR